MLDSMLDVTRHFIFMRFEYVQDMSNSTRANTRTLHECTCTSTKGYRIFLSLCLEAVIVHNWKAISGRVFHNLQELMYKENN